MKRFLRELYLWDLVSFAATLRRWLLNVTKKGPQKRPTFDDHLAWVSWLHVLRGEERQPLKFNMSRFHGPAV